jgi:hypothetical protein
MNAKRHEFGGIVGPLACGGGGEIDEKDVRLGDVLALPPACAKRCPAPTPIPIPTGRVGVLESETRSAEKT